MGSVSSHLLARHGIVAPEDVIGAYMDEARPSFRANLRQRAGRRGVAERGLTRADLALIDIGDAGRVNEGLEIVVRQRRADPLRVEHVEMFALEGDHAPGARAAPRQGGPHASARADDHDCARC